MSRHNKISVVTVTYNSGDTIYKLINSLKLIDDVIENIIVIDNNSESFDSKKINNINPKTIVICNKKNLGFAKAINKGIRKIKTELILIINPDSYLENKSILKSISFIQRNKKIGAIGGKIFNGKKKAFTATTTPTFLTGIFEFTNLKKIFPKNKFSKKFWIETIKNIKQPISVTSLCGAYIIIRKKINNSLNLFDEKYFLYLEDIDFGIKINNQGYKVIFDPRSNIQHVGGYSSKNKYKTDLTSWYKSRDIFFKKHLNPIKAIILVSIFKIEKILLNIYHFIKHDSEPSLSHSSHQKRIKKH